MDCARNVVEFIVRECVFACVWHVAEMYNLKKIVWTINHRANFYITFLAVQLSNYHKYEFPEQ